MSFGSKVKCVIVSLMKFSTFSRISSKIIASRFPYKIIVRFVHFIIIPLLLFLSISFFFVVSMMNLDLYMRFLCICVCVHHCFSYAYVCVCVCLKIFSAINYNRFVEYDYIVTFYDHILTSNNTESTIRFLFSFF